MEVSSHPGLRPSHPWPRILRGGHPRQPRHRPSRPRTASVRSPRSTKRHQAASAPASSPRAFSPASASTTSAAESSSTSSSHAPCAPRPRFNDAYDFDVGTQPRQPRSPARSIGRNINHRLLSLERVAQHCAIASRTVERIVLPTVTDRRTTRARAALGRSSHHGSLRLSAGSPSSPHRGLHERQPPRPDRAALRRRTRRATAQTE